MRTRGFAWLDRIRPAIGAVGAWAWIVIASLAVAVISVGGSGALTASGAPIASAPSPGAQAEAGLPADVDPTSRNRLAIPAPDPAGGPTAAADAIRAAGSGANVRWDAAAGRPLLELAILITAREHDAPFEWTLHELEALAVGLDPAVIDVVRNREPLDGLGEREATIVRAGREIFGAHRLSSETYRRAVAPFGEAGFVDIVTLMGRYAGTAARLAAFNQQMPPGWPQLLPLPFTPPDDVDPRSRSRLEPLPAPPEITRATPSLYGRTLSPYGTGPGQIRGHGAGRASLEASVPRPLLDLAVLVTARAYDVQYTWTLTEPVARENGLDPAVIEAVRDGASVAGLGEKEAALVTFGRELFGPHTVSPATYAGAVAAVGGTTNLVDLVDLMAGHVADATLLIAFDQHLPPGRASLLTAR